MGNDTPCYNLEDFISACADNKVEVWPPALRDARYFGFRDRDERKILTFIASGGLEGVEFLKIEPWRGSPENPPPLVDAYSFWSGGKKGYIAFFYSLQEKQWEMKSFKEHKTFDNQLTDKLKQLELDINK